MAAPESQAPQSIPALEELKALPQWVGWHYEVRKGKRTKPPLSVHTHRHASSTDRKTWSDFTRANLERIRCGWEGVGFVVTKDDPYVGVDVDGCVQDGAVEPWAREIVDRVNSYTEITPSGHGLRIFVKGVLPPGGRNKRRPSTIEGVEAGVEAYSEGKYLTVTGKHLPGTPTTIEERSEALAWLVQKYLSDQPSLSIVPVEKASAALSDHDLWQRMFSSVLGAKIRELYHKRPVEGENWSGFDWDLIDHLLFWTEGDTARTDRMFRQTGLMRPKWDEKHSATGETYGQVTLRKRLAIHRKKHGLTGEPAAVETITERLLPAKGFFSLRDLMSRELPAPDHAVPGLIQRGLSILAGKPKVGKSWLVLNILLSVSAGGVALGRVECPRHDVLYLALEDTERRLQDRVKKILGEGAEVPEGFTVRMECKKLDQGGIETIEEWLIDHPDAALVVIDVWKRVKPNVPKGMNAYDADYDFGALLKALADKYRVAIVVIHHLNKMKDEDDYVDLISGSLGFAGAADEFMVLLRTQGGATFKGRGRDVEEFDYALEWSRELGTWTITGSAEEVQETKETRETIQVVEEFGKPIRPAQLATALGIRVEAAKKRLYRLAKRKLLTDMNDGTYYTIPKIEIPVSLENRVPGVPGVPVETDPPKPYRIIPTKNTPDSKGHRGHQDTKDTQDSQDSIFVSLNKQDKNGLEAIVPGVPSSGADFSVSTPPGKVCPHCNLNWIQGALINVGACSDCIKNGLHREH